MSFSNTPQSINSIVDTALCNLAASYQELLSTQKALSEEISLLEVRLSDLRDLKSKVDSSVNALRGRNK